MAGNGDTTLLFGGVKFGTGDVNDIFSFSGTGWTPVVIPAPLPAPRNSAGFSWDGNNFVLFGGYDGNYLNDTWRLILDPAGNRWEQACDPCPPIGRALPVFEYLESADDTKEGALLLDGITVDALGNTVFIADAWFWNGKAWEQLLDTETTTDVQTPGFPVFTLGASLPAAGRVLYLTNQWDATESQFERHTAELYLIMPTPPAPPNPTSQAQAAGIAIGDPALPFTGTSSGLLMSLALVLIIVGITSIVLPTILRRRRELLSAQPS